MLTFQPCCILAMFQNIGQQWPVPLFKVGFGSQFILLSYYIYSKNALHLPETKQENKQTNETNLETNKQTNNENCTAAVDQICIKGTYLPRAWVSGCFPSSLCPAAGKSLNVDKAWQWDCSVSDCIRLLCIRLYQAALYQSNHQNYGKHLLRSILFSFSRPLLKSWGKPQWGWISIEQ